MLRRRYKARYVGLFRPYVGIDDLCQKWRITMKYRIIAWAAITLIAVCLGPYVYALNDLITWR